jgi:glycosyltransferase involved in cell wall biosynthesis
MKPRLCLAQPGVNYLPHVPKVLSRKPILESLQKDFDVTLVVRKCVVPEALSVEVLTILDPDTMSPAERQFTSGYFAPTDFLSAVKYLYLIEQFARQHHQDFDVIIEYESPFLGAFSQAFHRRGVPTLMMIEADHNYEAVKLAPFSWALLRSPQAGLRRLAQIGFQPVQQRLRRCWVRQATAVITETVQMQRYLERAGYLPATTPIFPIPMAVNSTLFFPRDRQACRHRLGIAPETTVITYVGSLNRFIQEPGPLIEALGREQVPRLELHMVGDGQKRPELAAIARRWNASVIFHGQCPQADVSLYIGAADLCAAPYNIDRYAVGEMTSASLKVPEYLACGRPVLTIACSRMNDLLDSGRYGFQVDNQVAAYRQFIRQNLRDSPIAVLRPYETEILSALAQGVLRQKNIVSSGADIADLYRQAIQVFLPQMMAN